MVTVLKLFLIFRILTPPSFPSLYDLDFKVTETEAIHTFTHTEPLSPATVLGAGGTPVTRGRPQSYGAHILAGEKTMNRVYGQIQSPADVKCGQK